MNRYRVVISGLSFRYFLGYYYAESPDDAKQQAWNKNRSTFMDCSINMLSAVMEN
jgi:hypothetical protein